MKVSIAVVSALRDLVKRDMRMRRLYFGVFFDSTEARARGTRDRKRKVQTPEGKVFPRFAGTRATSRCEGDKVIL